jgi:hypothetical protein
MRRKRISKKKLLRTLVSLTFCAVIGSVLLPHSIRASCRINDISLEKPDKFTKLTIHAEKPFEFVHSALEEKEGKPYRVVIDCKDAIHNLPQHNFRSDLPSGTIKAIRTSQFQTEPERIVRIVLDFDEPVIYKVVESGEKGRGSVAILTAHDPDFTLWSAREREEVAPEGELASSVSPEKTLKETSKAKGGVLTSTENAKAQEQKKSTTLERPLSFADTSETGTHNQVSRVSSPKKEKVVLASGATSAEVFSVPKPDNRKLRPEAKKEAPESHSPVTSASTKDSGPTSRDAESEQNQVEKKASSKRTVSSAAEASKATAATTEETPAAVSDPTSREEGTAVSAPQVASPKKEADLPESLVVVSKPAGTPVEGTPTRETIYYQSEGRRDPFAPLTERISTELGQIPLPTFESLKLVGILKDEAGNRALLEDDRGYGYILKKGDKIKNGYVVSVDNNQVVFQIQEYGWSKTIALELFNRTSKAR